MNQAGTKVVADALIQKIQQLSVDHPKWAKVFSVTFANTLETTIRSQDDGSVFVLTGDIPAMWLRDSTAQVRPYLVMTRESNEMYDLIKGVVQRQFSFISIDAYANAFNESADGAGHQTDITQMSPWIWERKYEVDSLCYPIQLAYLLYVNSGRTEQFNETFVKAVKRILDVFELELDHEKSDYLFERLNGPSSDTLPNDGKGTPVSPTGMTWSGFRPSDDACDYGYLVPANMFAVVVLGYLDKIFTSIIIDSDIANRAKKLQNQIKDGINKYALVTNHAGKQVYAYEIDGQGNFKLMDDANVPSLLAAPYLGYCEIDDSLYQNTRETTLSAENPYYYVGKYAAGIGSAHTKENYVWPIAMAMEGLTTTDRLRQAEILDQLVTIDNGTDMMHESIDVDDPSHYSRPWFSWANMMFCELVMAYYGIMVKK